jgi:hypothetical protein
MQHCWRHVFSIVGLQHTLAAAFTNRFEFTFLKDPPCQKKQR